MTDTNPTQIHATGEATGFIPAPGDKGKPITVIGTNSIRAGFDATCLQQALNARGAPGVTDLVLNPDAHASYGAPVGCVLTSPTHVYAGPVGVDIKCSMSFLQLDLPADQVAPSASRAFGSAASSFPLPDDSADVSCASSFSTNSLQRRCTSASMNAVLSFLASSENQEEVHLLISD